MDMTLVIAKIYGIYLLVVGIALIINTGQFRKFYNEAVNSATLLLYGGIIALLMGAFTVTVHNIWVADWPVVVTIFGWWALIKGAALIAIPDLWMGAFKSMRTASEMTFRIIGLIAALVGAWLIYMSCV